MLTMPRGMTVARRIVWRLEDLNKETIKLKDLELIIMEEAGISERTIQKWIKVLKKLGYINRLNRHDFKLTN